MTLSSAALTLTDYFIPSGRRRGCDKSGFGGNGCAGRAARGDSFGVAGVGPFAEAVDSGVGAAVMVAAAVSALASVARSSARRLADSDCLALVASRLVFIVRGPADLNRFS